MKLQKLNVFADYKAILENKKYMIIWVLIH